MVLPVGNGESRPTSALRVRPAKGEFAAIAAIHINENGDQKAADKFHFTV
jgi:hypothetical protein